jgi:hypothetical protein
MNRIICSDALEALRSLPDAIIQTCVTSPPYYGLRDYGVEGQIGLEEAPEAFTQKLVGVFREAPVAEGCLGARSATGGVRGQLTDSIDLRGPDSDAGLFSIR